MKLYTVLPCLACFLAGIALDMSLSRIVMDIVFIVAMVVTALVLTLMARKPRKKSIPRRSSNHLKVVKSRKKSSGTSKSRFLGQAR